jgi:hypothetical protein
VHSSDGTPSRRAASSASLSRDVSSGPGMARELTACRCQRHALRRLPTACRADRD